MTELEKKLNKALGLEDLTTKGPTFGATQGAEKNTMCHDYDEQKPKKKKIKKK